MIYKQHLEQKRTELQNLMAVIGDNNHFPEIVPSPIVKGCRTRAKYKIGGNPESFSIKGTDPLNGEVSYEEALWLLPEWGRKMVARIIDVISDNLEEYWVDGLEVQLSHGNKHAHLTLSVKKQDQKSYSNLAHSLLEQVNALSGVSIPSKRKDYGKSYLLHRVDKKTFYSQYAAFFQPNACLTTRLVNEIKNWYSGMDFDGLLDLYCGVGLFSLSIAENGIPICGVDINKRAIDSARLNARSQGLNQASFLCCPVENFLPSASINSRHLVIIDPPRSGCPASLIRILSERGPDQICSISCHLPSHIRDLKQWIENGYYVHSLTALDMFPFTEFLETVAFLRRTHPVSCQG
jgi:tRNA/tmRNA/rRNA uracil-C5-methylase (TrmA/RlmC/RlmD family)